MHPAAGHVWTRWRCDGVLDESDVLPGDVGVTETHHGVHDRLFRSATSVSIYLYNLYMINSGLYINILLQLYSRHLISDSVQMVKFLNSFTRRIEFFF